MTFFSEKILNEKDLPDGYECGKSSCCECLFGQLDLYCIDMCTCCREPCNEFIDEIENDDFDIESIEAIE